jgi:hypothetical protein
MPVRHGAVKCSTMPIGWVLAFWLTKASPEALVAFPQLLTVASALGAIRLLTESAPATKTPLSVTLSVGAAARGAPGLPTRGGKMAVVLLETNKLRTAGALPVVSALEWGADLFVSSDDRQIRAAPKGRLAPRHI